MPLALFLHLFAMKWWDQMPWSLFSECWALSQLFHSPLSLSSRVSLVLLCSGVAKKQTWLTIWTDFLSVFQWRPVLLSSHFFCFSEFKCINYLLRSWRGHLVGEHHCRVCTLVSWGWGWGGAGFDGPQVTSFLRVCQHLCLGVQWYHVSSQMWGRDFLFLSGFHCPIGGRVGSQVSGAEALNVRPDLAVLPQVCTLPTPSTATLATEDQEERVLVRKITKGANLQAGCLQRSRLPPTCHHH